MSVNLEQMMVQWQPPTMIETLFTQLDVGNCVMMRSEFLADV